MNYKQVSSSFIDSIGYDAATGDMEVCFMNGSSTVHNNVSESTHKQLIESESIGKHYNQNFKSGSAASKIIPVKQLHFKR